MDTFYILLAYPWYLERKRYLLGIRCIYALSENGLSLLSSLRESFSREALSHSQLQLKVDVSVNIDWGRFEGCG